MRRLTRLGGRWGVAGDRENGKGKVEDGKAEDLCRRRASFKKKKELKPRYKGKSAEDTEKRWWWRRRIFG
jgi:hypothetical protein